MKLEILNVTIEVNPKKLLETQVITKNGNYPKKKKPKDTKLSVLWSPNMPKPYKKNIQSEFQQTLAKKFRQLKKKFSAANYPQELVESVTRNFENDKKNSVEDNYIILPGFFDLGKPVIVVARN